MQRKFSLLICFLFPFILSLAQCPSQEPLRIVGLTHTDSRCENSGTISAVMAGGTAPYIYTLTSPSVNITSTDGIFLALPPGNYQLRIVDQCSQQLTRNVIISKQYEPFQVTANTVSSDCAQTSNGSIEVIVQRGGRSPFIYSLIEPSEMTRGPQSSGLFTGLTNGTYTYKVEDSCGNFQTRTAVITDNYDFRITAEPAGLLYKGCNNFSLDFSINADANANTSPYDVWLTLPDGRVLNQVLPNTGTISNGSFNFSYQHVQGVLGRFILEVGNGCARYIGKQVTLPFNLVAVSKPGPCGRSYDYVFDESRDNFPGSIYKLRCDTVLYTLISPSGSILASQYNNSRFSGFPPGNGYQVSREDCCGNKDFLTFNWEAPTAMTLSAEPLPADKAGTATISLRTNTGVPGSLVIYTGPTSIKFADESIFNYKYPDTIPDISFTSSGTARAGYFAAGNYLIKFIDTCNNQASALITISASHPRHLRKLTIDSDMEQGCINANKIWYKGTNNYLSDQLRLTGSVTRTIPLTAAFQDTIKNLPAGNYRLSYVFNLNSTPTNFLKAHQGIGGDVIVKNFFIPAYVPPGFFPQAAIATCGGLHNFALLPNYDKGLEPFQFAITAGPVTTVDQTSPAFTNMPAGLYTLRMSDVCGNSYSLQLSIKELSIPAFTLADETCINNRLVITLGNVESPYYSYLWEHPDGHFSFEKDMVLDPFTAASIGTYKLTVTSNVEGCFNTMDTSFVLTGCKTLPVRFLDFSVSHKASQYLLYWRVAELESNQYFVIEKSRDGRNFNKAGILIPENEKMEFRFTHQENIGGKQWYRIAIMQNNRVVTCSKILGTGADKEKFLLYPNPVAGGNLFIRLPSFRTGASISIHDIMGRMVLHQTIKPVTQLMQWDITQLPAGTYLLKFIANEQPIYRSFIKL